MLYDQILNCKNEKRSKRLITDIQQQQFTTVLHDIFTAGYWVHDYHIYNRPKVIVEYCCYKVKWMSYFKEPSGLKLILHQ